MAPSAKFGGKVMKYKIKILGTLMLVCMLFVVACGRPEPEPGATDGAGEETETPYEGEEPGESDDGEEVQEDTYQGTEESPEGSPNGEVSEEGEETTIVVYQSNPEGDRLISTEGVPIESLTPENVLQTLIDKGEMSSDVRVLSFNQSGGLIKLDLSPEFNDFMAAQGSWGEFVVLGSVVNTFLSAFNAENILITVGGGVLSTPHVGEMSEPMGRFDIFGE